ncbi:17103_t:CDS:1, partial [Cetraspora pellucida]
MPRSPENAVHKLNKQITQIKYKLIENPEREELHIILDELDYKLQNKLSNLSEQWQLRSNARWIEN